MENIEGLNTEELNYLLNDIETLQEFLAEESFVSSLTPEQLELIQQYIPK